MKADPDRAPTLTIERYREDWTHLNDASKRTGHWTEPFKYLALHNDGSVYLTTGLEARSRYEGYDNPNWGSTPDEGFIWHRLMPYADLHVGNVRFFAQPILSAISAPDDRSKTPVDTTGVDFLQAFMEIELAVGDGISVRASAGRKLLSLGVGRFVSTRYGPGIPQAFDGIDVLAGGRTRQVTGFYVEPVDTSPGDFDDRRSRQRALWGVYATQWLGEDRSFGIDAYYLGFRNRRAAFEQGTGRQLLHTFGSRMFGGAGPWDWNVEAAIQRGSFAGRRNAAWGIAGEIGYQARPLPLQPVFRIQADVVSGDEDPDDPTLESFNSLFPNGKYLGDLTPVGPRNLMHVRPSVAINPRENLQIEVTGAGFWRQSTNDGVYAVPGTLLRSGSGSGARYIGKQFGLATTWLATSELNLSASISAFDPGSFIDETGPSRAIKMVSVTANFRF